MSSIWTDERVRSAKALYDIGNSAAECAATLSKEFGFPLTRNSIVGLWFRQKFNGREAKPNNYRAHAPRSAEALDKRRRIRPPPTPSAEKFYMRTAESVPLHIAFADLTSANCHYPYGDGPFTFCGCEAVRGLSYCAPHQRLTNNSNHLMSRTQWKQHQRRYAGKLRAGVSA